MTTRMLPGVVFLALLPALSRADDAAALTPGTRVRVTSGAVSPLRLVGTVIAHDDDTLTVVNENRQTLKLPRGQVSRVEVSWGRRSHWWQGMLVGGAAGAAIGLAEGATCDSYGCYTRGQNTLYGSLGMAGVGALIGKMVKSDRWAGITFDAGRAGPGRTETLARGRRVGSRGVAIAASWKF